MVSSSVSVTEIFRHFESRSGVSAEEWWLAFLTYLELRLGVDLRTVCASDEIRAATQFVRQGGMATGYGLAASWFDLFGRRNDVLAALFDRFFAPRSPTEFDNLT